MEEPQPFTLELPSGARLHGLLDLPEARGPRPAVVVCHGFKGFMEWGFFPSLAALLAQRGFVAVRFNLSGTGMQPGDELVTDERAFRDNTHGRELDELLAVLAALGETIAPGRIEAERIGLLGHSRGGGNAILAAALPPWRERVRALVTWAAIAAVDRYTPQQKEAWRRDGELPVVNARTGQRLALGLSLLEDVERNAAGRLDILGAAATLTAPWLIVHGEDDESVPAADAHRLDERAEQAAQARTAEPGAAREAVQGTARGAEQGVTRARGAEPPEGRAPRAAAAHELLLIPGANHTFGSRHPFAGPTPHLIQALNATQTWFRRYL